MVSKALLKSKIIIRPDLLQISQYFMVQYTVHVFSPMNLPAMNQV